MTNKNIPEHEGSSAIKWGIIHERLEISRSFLEKGSKVTEEERKNILRARARVLAQEPNKAKADQTFIEVLEFLLAHERYAVETSYIREVYPLKELTALPCTPPFLLGVINVRGQILSVIDIKKFFDLPEKGLTNLNRVIIVKKDKMELGILSDEIIGVRNIPQDDLQPSLPTLSGIRSKYLKGVTSEQLIVLEIEKLISDENIIVHEEVDV
jgi:purine-binding chemotaxis protein CheW